jgi:hypothetical protein
MAGQELTELEHPGIAEDVVGRAPGDVAPCWKQLRKGERAYELNPTSQSR